jgi:hypothetical protein
MDGGGFVHPGYVWLDADEQTSEKVAAIPRNWVCR